MAQKSIDTIGNVLNIECEVTFMPLCRSVCHPAAKVFPILFENYSNKTVIIIEGPVLRIISLPQQLSAVALLHI